MHRIPFVCNGNIRRSALFEYLTGTCAPELPVAGAR